MADWNKYYDDNDNANDNRFVGIKKEYNCNSNNQDDSDNFHITVYFPIGIYYSFGSQKRRNILLSSVDSNYKVEYDLFKKDLNLLIIALCKCKQRFDKLGIDTIKFESDNNIFPLESYYFIIIDFLENGYYKEIITTHETSMKGDINWKRTIKNQTAYIQNNESIYTQFVVNTPKEIDTLITSIHKFCVYISFKILGFLFFNDYIPEKPDIEFQKDLFLSAIEQKLFTVFDDRTRMLLSSMKSIINCEYRDSDFNCNNFSCGTYEFWFVWEEMIKYNISSEETDNWYIPTYWNLVDETESEKQNREKNEGNAHKLKPDSVTVYNNDIYILDPKYYHYAETKENKESLPWGTNINKQITYGEYTYRIAKTKKAIPNFNKIYNAFVLPYNSGINSIKHYEYIGYAYGDWKPNNCSYGKILGYFLDTRTIMESYVNGGYNFDNFLDDIKKQYNKINRFNTK